MTNEGCRRVECRSNGLLGVEEDGGEEGERKTPINKPPHIPLEIY